MVDLSSAVSCGKPTMLRGADAGTRAALAACRRSSLGADMCSATPPCRRLLTARGCIRTPWHGSGRKVGCEGPSRTHAFTRGLAHCQGQCGKRVTCRARGKFVSVRPRDTLRDPLRGSPTRFAGPRRFVRYRPCGRACRGHPASFRTCAARRECAARRHSPTDRLGAPRIRGAPLPLVDPGIGRHGDARRHWRRSHVAAQLPGSGHDLDPVSRVPRRHRPRAHRREPVVRILRLGRFAQVVRCARSSGTRPQAVPLIGARGRRRVCGIRGQRYLPSRAISHRGGPDGRLVSAR